MSDDDRPVKQPKRHYKFPKTIGACADHLYQVRADRLARQKVVDDLQAEETALREHIIQTLPKSQASGVAGKLARVTVVTQAIPQVKDWTRFYQYVHKHKAFELLQRRLSKGAIEERLEGGAKLPGVELFNAVTVSLNKL